MSKELSKYYNEPLMYAIQYHKEGLAVIPLKFKTKEAAIKWRQYQKKRPPAIKLEKWFKKSEPKNIAIICGVVSGNLIVMDFDEEDKYYEFLNTIDEDLKNIILGTRTVITNRGRHVYLRVDSDEKTFRELFPSKRSEKWHVDFQSEGKYVVAPPSVHPSGQKYELEGEWIDIKKVSIETMLKIKRVLFPEDKLPTEILKTSKNASFNKSQKKNGLTEADMLEIANVLAPAYKEGFRNNIVYSLSGWLAKAGISMEDALKVATFLAQKGDDPDYETPEFRNRLDVVTRSYEKWRCGINVAGKKYLVEFLEGALEDEEQVISIMKRLEELIGVPSTSSGMIFVDENESEGLVYYADLAEKYIGKGQFKDKSGSKKTFLKKGRIIEAVPTKAIRYIDPISGTENLDIVFESNLSPVPLTLQGVERRDILSVLKRNGYIVKNRIAEDALNAILNNMILSGLVETKTEFSKMGVFWYQGEMHYTKIKLPEEIRR
ncbi:hypothetical protein APY94_03725 [Thermococcus celericrescens]|uniref:DNA primase/polymerase bifunctional N-terminal domain-containing protein n=1 Tax=Thermococcus celericrescens TaxID=227598 RepID=A0A100XYS3_9EURY|nr:bifunctional DNA primase/polymerase [Thermococcus celericrescens]KUH33993.1 hypothetical protein APY94_03725 [Thermococcus celericrescens]